MKLFKKKRNGLKRELFLLGVKFFSYTKKDASSKHMRIGKTSRVDNHSTIGKYTYIGEYCTVTKAIIGRYVSIGNNVTIGPGEHNLNRVSTSSSLYDVNNYDDLTKQPCMIGNDVWIGVDAIIRRGVKIGNGAVVGANSFVNKDVPDFAIVAGNPAKIIRYRFPENIQQKIIKSDWWNKDLDEAKVLIKKLECLLEERRGL